MTWAQNFRQGSGGRESGSYGLAGGLSLVAAITSAALVAPSQAAAGRICYLGREGQPSGCVNIYTPMVPRFGRIAS